MKALLETVRDGHRVLPVEVGATAEFWPEEVRKRSLTSKLYSSPDGKRRCIVARTGPVHYKPGGLESDDPWEEIDLSNPDDLKALYRLTRLRDGIGYTWTCREDDSESVTVRLLGFSDLPAPELREDGVVYWKDVAPGLDIYMRPMPHRYGIFKVLKDERAPRTFSFRVSYSKSPKLAVTKRGSFSAPGLASDIAEGIADLVELRFDRCFMPARLAWDRDDSPVEVKAGIKGDLLTEEVVLPQDFDAYPVTVDTDLEYQTVSGSDDGWVQASRPDDAAPISGALNTAWIRFGKYSSYYIRLGARFQNVVVPKSANLQILSAVLRLRGDSSLTLELPPPFAVSAEAADDSATWASANEIWTRPRTNASVPWIIQDQWALGTLYDSPDISSVIQEVCDREGWLSGNAISCFVDPTATSSGTMNYRQTSGYEREPVGECGPKLLVTYEVYIPPDVTVEVENAANRSFEAPIPEVGVFRDATVSCEPPAVGIGALEPSIQTTIGQIIEALVATAQAEARTPVVEAQASSDILVGNPARAYCYLPPAEAIVDRSVLIETEIAEMGLAAREPIALTSGSIIVAAPQARIDLALNPPAVGTQLSVTVEPPAASLLAGGLEPLPIGSINLRVEVLTSRVTASAPAPSVEAVRNVLEEPPEAAMLLTAIIPSSITTGGYAVIAVPAAQLVGDVLPPEIVATIRPYARGAIHAKVKPTRLTVWLKDTRTHAKVQDTRTKVVIR